MTRLIPYMGMLLWLVEIFDKYISLKIHQKSEKNCKNILNRRKCAAVRGLSFDILFIIFRINFEKILWKKQKFDFSFFQFLTVKLKICNVGTRNGIVHLKGHSISYIPVRKFKKLRLANGPLLAVWKLPTRVKSTVKMIKIAWVRHIYVRPFMYGSLCTETFMYRHVYVRKRENNPLLCRPFTTVFSRWKSPDSTQISVIGEHCARAVRLIEYTNSLSHLFTTNCKYSPTTTSDHWGCCRIGAYTHRYIRMVSKCSSKRTKKTTHNIASPSASNSN